jgi:transposase
MLGIDVSSQSLSAALCLHPQEKVRWQREVPNTVAGIGELIKATPKDVPWVVEPTGRYSQLVVQQAHNAGRTVLLAPPRKAKAFLSSLTSRAKTDRLDSCGLALFGHSRPLSPYRLKSETVDQLDQLLSARRGISKARSNLRLQADSLPLAKVALAPSIEALTQQIKELDKQIAAMAKQHPEFAMAENLEQVPGIGPVTATALVSRLTAKQFTHPDQLVTYVGLDIGVRDSGKRTGQIGLTKQGDAELRRLLYLCAQASLRSKDSPFKTQYDKERAKGLSTTGALCAVARKLAHVCWSIHKHQTTYDAKRVGQAKVTSERDREDRATLGSDPSARSGARPPESCPPAPNNAGGRPLKRKTQN